MSFVKLYVHAVWSTKDRLPFLSDNIREKLINHIKDYAQSKGVFRIITLA
jgi:putative transposase